MIDNVERSVKPVIAAVNGVCMGGGLELALGCHYRIATQDALLALPEVKIGLLPGAGGTQRLPRAMGAEKALQMIVSGEPISAGDALKHGLVARIVPNTSFNGVLEFAREIARKGKHPKLRDQSATLSGGQASDAFFGEARTQAAKHSRGLPAPIRCIEAVEAAVKLPFEQGLALERKLLSNSCNRTNRRRCATCSSPSVPHRRFPMCRTTRERARSTEPGSSVSARWEVALR